MTDPNNVQDILETKSLKETKNGIVLANEKKNRSQNESQKGSRFVIPESENHVELLDIELHGLPAEASDENVIKKMFLNNAHVVHSKPDVDTITGACRGTAKVKLRCQNGLKSDALLKRLYNKGCKFTIQTQ